MDHREYLEILEEVVLRQPVESGMDEYSDVPLWKIREEVLRAREKRAENDSEKARRVVIRYRREPGSPWRQGTLLDGNMCFLDDGLWHSHLWVNNGIAAREYVKILSRRFPGEYRIEDVQKGPGFPDLGWGRGREWSWNFSDPELQKELEETRSRIDRDYWTARKRARDSR